MYMRRLFISDSSQLQKSQRTLSLQGEQLHVSHGRGHTWWSGSRYWAGSDDRWRSVMLSSRCSWSAAHRSKPFPSVWKSSCTFLFWIFLLQRPSVKLYAFTHLCMDVILAQGIGTVCFSSHTLVITECFVKLFIFTVPWEMSNTAKTLPQSPGS